jgi:class 3 adenylate cyclase
MPSPVLDALREQLGRTKRMAERAFEQLEDEHFFFRLNLRQNSIHVIVKHLAGNMRSRWTDFLTADGEKPDRDRESEFVEDAAPRAQIVRTWEDGWAAVFAALEPLTDRDLTRTVHIRREPMTAAQAIVRQVEHYGYHVGQIVLIAKHLRGEKWNYLTVPPGGSAEFNRSKGHA